MKRRQLDKGAVEVISTELQRLNFTWAESLNRLGRAADAIRAGQVVEQEDREFISCVLEEERGGRTQGGNALAAQFANELALKQKISLRLAARLSVTRARDVPALLKAITRLRSAEADRRRQRRAKKD